MLESTRRRAGKITLFGAVCVGAMWAMVMFVAVPMAFKPEPPAEPMPEPEPPAYVEELHQRLDVIEAKLDGVMFRLEQTEDISGKTYDMLDDLLGDL